MAITAAMVKELREMTGAGMMDCKKALTETNGDMDAAVDVLKKSGAAKMEKKQSRIAAEGIARVAVNGNVAVVAEVNSETDFVAKNETFQEFVQTVADTALASDLNGGANGEDIEALLATNGLSDLLVEKTATIGEKLSVRRFAKVTGDAVASYIHGGGRIGVVIAADGASDDAAKEALTNIAMQVAAMNPQYISRNDISAEELAKIKEITIDSALNDATTLPKPILNKLLDKAIGEKVWSDEDINVENLVRIFIRSAVKSKIYFMCISLFCHIVLGINPRHNFIVSRFLCLLPTAFCIRSLHIFRIRNILRNGCLSRFLQSLYMAAQTCYLHRQKDNCQQ